MIVTGMSGAGRSTAANVLEDQGWYVVDNLPPQLLPDLAGLVDASAADVPRLAAVVDVRSRAFFTDFRAGLERLRDDGWRPSVVFMDATDEALVRRFESVRRPHPLQGEGRMLDGIIREREILRDLRSNADILIDTSGLNVHQLSAKVHELVRDFVLGQPGAREFLDGVLALLEPMTQGYLREGRSYVTLAVGCTGGKHRSVAMAEELAKRLASDQLGTLVVHRDLGRE